MTTDVTKVIRNGQVEVDCWTHLSDDETTEAAQRCTVDLDRFLRETRDQLNATSYGGIRLPNTTDLSSLDGRLEGITLLTIQFPKFTDGRGYTLARDLRVRLKYTGEIRAVGDITRDQLLYLSRCGFDSYVLKPGKDPHDALKAFSEQSVRYQPEIGQAG